MRKKCVHYVSSLPSEACSPDREDRHPALQGGLFHGHTVHGINLYI